MLALLSETGVRGKICRAATLLIGLVVPQVVLFGPSLVGNRILLPLNFLHGEGIYLPPDAGAQAAPEARRVLSDQVVQFEYWRRFCAAELRAGRLPLWTDTLFAGAPLVYPIFSPFNLIYYSFDSPVALAWMQLAKALLAGTGVYLFCRRVLGVSFWPAAVGAWCYPLTAFNMLWLGYYATCVTPLLPWLLLTTDRAVRRPLGWGPPALAAVTGLTMISGGIDTALQVMLVSGLFAVWCLFDEYGKQLLTWRGVRAVGLTGAGWALGFLLAGFHLGPLLEYVPSGARMVERARGKEERPPTGLSALPALVVPDIYGHHGPDSVGLTPSNLLEDAPAAYAGLLATLLLAPLAWCSRRHRSLNFFWTLLAVVAVAWQLNLPGLVQVLRLPGLNMLSHNRFVFAASFAILALAVTGLEAVRQREARWHWGFVVPVLMLLALAAVCVYHLNYPPWLAWPRWLANVPQPEQLSRPAVRDSFLWAYRRGLLLSGLALVGWACLWVKGTLRPGWMVPVVVILEAELLLFAQKTNLQSDPELYYPPLPVLEFLKQAPPGRILAVGCLPTNLVAIQGLRDIRGYDAIDPLYLMQVLEFARVSPKHDNPSYARTMFFQPRIVHGPAGDPVLSPLLDMLNVRYLIFYSDPAPVAHVLFRSGGYWVAENKHALPRAFVPAMVVPAPGKDASLSKIALRWFDPKEVAYVDAAVPVQEGCHGRVEIVDDNPTAVTLGVDMETPGLVVLADLWYPGWHAYLNGQPVPVLRTNHALRGVQVPAGRGTLVFRYEPASFTWGVRAMAVALALLLAWAAAVFLSGRRRAAAAGPAAASASNPAQPAPSRLEPARQ